MMFVKPNVVLVEDTGSVLYNVDSSGVYIQHVDGTLYTTDEWTAGGFTSDLANGVAVIDAACQFVAAKEQVSTSGTSWYPNGLVSGVMAETTQSIAETDYAGVENTAVIIATGNATNGAADKCAKYTFPNGQTGYLPALGELMVYNKYREDIQAALSLIGAQDGNNVLWSSTQYDASYAWGLQALFERAEYSKKAPSGGSYNRVRAFTTLSLQHYDMPTTFTSLDLVFIQRGHRETSDGRDGLGSDDEETASTTR